MILLGYFSLLWKKLLLFGFWQEFVHPNRVTKTRIPVSDDTLRVILSPGRCISLNKDLLLCALVYPKLWTFWALKRVLQFWPPVTISWAFLKKYLCKTWQAWDWSRPKDPQCISILSIHVSCSLRYLAEPSASNSADTFCSAEWYFSFLKSQLDQRLFSQ